MRRKRKGCLRCGCHCNKNMEVKKINKTRVVINPFHYKKKTLVKLFYPYQTCKKGAIYVTTNFTNQMGKRRSSINQPTQTCSYTSRQSPRLIPGDLFLTLGDTFFLTWDYSWCWHIYCPDPVKHQALIKLHGNLQIKPHPLALVQRPVFFWN